MRLAGIRRGLGSLVCRLRPRTCCFGFYALLGGSGLLRLRLRSLGPRVAVHIYLSAFRSIYVLMYIHQKAYIHTYIHTYILYGKYRNLLFQPFSLSRRYFKVDLVRGFRSSDPQNILEPFQRNPAAQQPYQKRNYTLTVNPSPSAESDSLQTSSWSLFFFRASSFSVAKLGLELRFGLRGLSCLY